MSFDYAWQAGPDVAGLADLADYCNFVRLLSGAETSAGLRGENVLSPYRHGRIPVPEKYLTEKLVGLEVSYRETDASGVVTHPDGRAGHLYENRSTVERLLRGRKGQTLVRRTAPDYGTVEIEAERFGPTLQTQDRFTYQYILRVPSGSWRSTTESSATTSPVTVVGDVPIGDAIFEIVGGTNVVWTFTADGATINVVGATPAGGVRVDLGAVDAFPVTKISDGSDYGEFVWFGRKDYVVLEPGANAYTSTGGPTTLTTRWKERYG